MQASNVPAHEVPTAISEFVPQRTCIRAHCECTNSVPSLKTQSEHIAGTGSNATDCACVAAIIAFSEL